MARSTNIWRGHDLLRLCCNIRQWDDSYSVIHYPSPWSYHPERLLFGHPRPRFLDQVNQVHEALPIPWPLRIASHYLDRYYCWSLFTWSCRCSWRTGSVHSWTMVFTWKLYDGYLTVSQLLCFSIRSSSALVGNFDSITQRLLPRDPSLWATAVYKLLVLGTCITCIRNHLITDIH